MVYEHHIGWQIIDAAATLALGERAFEHHQNEGRMKMGYFGSSAAWAPAGRYSSLGPHFPGRLIKVLSAKSVGGIDGNHWSNIALVELNVQGTVLDRIVEATS